MSNDHTNTFIDIHTQGIGKTKYFDMVKLTEELVLARCRSKELASVRKINYW